MSELKFNVKGSGNEAYVVTFVKNGRNLFAYCTCKGAANGRSCKHRVSIMEGKKENIVSDNQDEVAIVASWVPGSVVGNILQDLQAAEKESVALKKRVTSLRKKLGKSMSE